MNTFRYKLLFWLFLLSLPALACGMETEPRFRTASQVKYTDTQPTHNVSIEMRVTAYQLNVRHSANGDIVDGFYLIQNDTVTVYAERTVGDIEWCRITPVENAPRWVACGWLIAEEE